MKNASKNSWIVFHKQYIRNLYIEYNRIILTAWEFLQATMGSSEVSNQKFVHAFKLESHVGCNSIFSTHISSLLQFSFFTDNQKVKLPNVDLFMFPRIFWFPFFISLAILLIFSSRGEHGWQKGYWVQQIPLFIF